MRRTLLGALAALLVGLAPSTALWAADVEPEQLRRGLIVTYRDNAKPTPAEVIQLDATIALALKVSEAAHPRLSADGGTVVWQGYINIVRGGTYRFTTKNLHGEFKLKIGDKLVFAASQKGPDRADKAGEEVQLEAGVQPLTAEFTRVPGIAWVEVYWQTNAFPAEPLPFSVLGHLPAQAKALEPSSRIERGRLLVEEAGCTNCHRPADNDRMAKTLVSRHGPDLSQVGKRVHPGWTERWLDDPQKMRPDAAMPALFTDDEDGRVEMHAVAHYLASLGGPVPDKDNGKNDKGSIARGKKLFVSTGCIACHGPYDAPVKPAPKVNERKPTHGHAHDGPRVYPLANLGSKSSPEVLADYLKNPLTVDPSGRMPHMELQGNEAQDLARYLCQAKDDKIGPGLSETPATKALLAAFKRVESRAEEVKAFEAIPQAAQVLDLGKRLVIDKGCNSCHTIAPGGKPFANVLADKDFKEIGEPSRHQKGCLSDGSARRGKAPVLFLDEFDRDAVRAFLKQGLAGAGSAAPGYEARATLQRFNCLACHSRDGEGGLTPDLVDELRRFENAENAEAVTPPPLTGIAHKLRAPYIKQVLSGGARARPWMSLRMPQFGEPNVGTLPQKLAALEGTEADDRIRKVEIDAAKIEAGKFLVGKGAFGCISCHDIAGIPNSGTRGPDLAGMNQRVRYDWYARWLEQPQRIQPGTRMPAIFFEGKSLVTKVYDGHADQQAEAIWGYLALGNNLPLPDGIEPAKKGMVLTVADKPVLLRTFLPEAGNRGIAVGFPNHVSAAFDANTCRLAYTWTGAFLDAAPVWDNRGGAPAHVVGARLWTAPPGCPVGVTTSAEPPDFAGRPTDPAYGAAMPEGKVFDGTPLLRFKGYSVDEHGAPTFRYTLQAGQDAEVKVSEKIETPRSSVAAGIGRRFTFDVPSGQTTWLLVGETTKEPRLLDTTGASVTLDLKSTKIDAPAATRRVVLPQDGEKVALFAPAATPDGSEWRLQRSGNKWQLLLRVPPASKDSKFQVDLNVWVPYRDEPGLLKELMSAK
jgi:mono/diheme cytochrome c family protein